MLARVRAAEPDLGWALLIAASFAALAFVLQSHVGFIPQDEGFLWYGAVQTARGDVPLHDFRSYDPGRYYWAAAWSFVFGDGIVALRASSSVFSGIGLVFGLLAARRAVPSRWWLVPIAALLTVWVFPPWKLHDSSLAMVAVYLALLLLEKPSVARHFAAGTFAGFAAFMGRNHGLYTVAAFALASALAWVKLERTQLARKLAASIAGVVAGYAPMLLLVIVVPGFGTTLVDSILFYLSQSELNVPLPVPWPWKAKYAELDAYAALTAFSVGVSFLLFPLVYLPALAWSTVTSPAKLRSGALLAASAIVGIVYTHHASVRSDVFHLAQSIHPCLLACIALPSAWRWPRPALALACILALLAFLAAFAIVPRQPLARKIAPKSDAYVHVECRIGEDDLWVEVETARLVERLSALVTANVRAEDTLWISAKLMGLYPILGRRSPVWDVYPAWKASDALQQRMVDELAAVDWVLMLDEPIGGQAKLRFSNLYPRVWERMQAEFVRVPTPGFAPTLLFLNRQRR